MKFYGLKSMIGHPVWHEDDHVLENVAVKFTVDYDKDYSQYALTWWSVGQSRGKSKVGERDITFEQSGKSVKMQLYRVGLKIKFTIL